MSSIYTNYASYLGASRCCNLKTTTTGSDGPTGPAGPIGAAGSQGPTGPTGSSTIEITSTLPSGYTGPTGGTVYFCTSTNCLYLYNGSAWFGFTGFGPV
jgi:hypothetical protein